MDTDTDKFSESFHSLSREELIDLLRNVLKENLRMSEELREIKSNGNDPSKTNSPKKEFARSDSQVEKSEMEFGSYGSTNVMFLKAADHSVTGANASYEMSPTDTTTVHQNYLNLERGQGAHKAPAVSDYRDLFKKSIVLEYEEDSPSFRKKIDSMDHTVEDLRHQLQLLVDRCGQYCLFGKEFVDSGKAFAAILSELADPIWEERLGSGLSNFLANFGHTFEMIESYREAVIASLETTFLAPMQEFVKLEAKSVNKLKSKVQENSDMYEAALARFLSLKVSVDDEVLQRKEKELSMLKKELELSRYDLVTELNSLETKKKFQLCERTCSALYTYLGFFHQCHTMVATMEPAMRTLTSEMAGARNDFRRQTMLNDAKRIRLRNELDKSKQSSGNGKNRHSRIVQVAAKGNIKMRRNLSMFTSQLGKSTTSLSTPDKDKERATFIDDQALGSPSADAAESGGGDTVKAGYLRKKTNNVMKEWKRRWFFIKEGKLYYARSNDLSDSPPIHVCDLLISTVRENREEGMRFTFEVVSPGQRVYTLQGESEQDTSEWVQALRGQIEKQLALQVAPPSPLKSKRDSITEEEGGAATNLESSTIDNLHKINHECADCGMPFPGWASLNLCIMICIECSGIHRSLGTHISKVRSISLDKWTKGNTELLKQIGNSRSNSLWEEKLNLAISLSDDEDEEAMGGPSLPSFPPKISCRATRRLREEFIHAKYVQRVYLNSAMPEAESSLKLYQAAEMGNLLEMMRALACGADVNWRNSEDSDRTSLHAACLGGHGLAVELLCQWNVNVDIADSTGKTAVDYSAEVSDTIVESLVRKLEGDLQYSQPSEGDLLLKLADENGYHNEPLDGAANASTEGTGSGLSQDFELNLPAPGNRGTRPRRRSSGEKMLAAAAAAVSAMAAATSPRRKSGEGEFFAPDQEDS